MVKKKDGSWRFCVDYHKLNEATHLDTYPLSQVDAKLDSLDGSTFFSTLDMASGYWQVEQEPHDRKRQLSRLPKAIFSLMLCFLAEQIPLPHSNV